MYDILKNIIGYNGQYQYDSNIIQLCEIVIPVLIVYFIWCFTKIISYICNYGKK